MQLYWVREKYNWRNRTFVVAAESLHQATQLAKDFIVNDAPLGELEINELSIPERPEVVEFTECTD